MGVSETAHRRESLRHVQLLPGGLAIRPSQTEIEEAFLEELARRGVEMVNAAERPMASESDAKPPWNPSVFWPLAILCGFGAAGVLAGLNYRRLGKPELTWPTIGIAVVAFVAVLVGLSFVEIEANSWLPFVVNVPPAFLLERLQRSEYTRWKERFPQAEGAGWGIPIMVGGAGVAVVLALLFVSLLVA